MGYETVHLVGVLTTTRDIDQFVNQKSASSKVIQMHYKCNAFVVQLVTLNGSVVDYVIDLQPVQPKLFRGI